VVRWAWLSRTDAWLRGPHPSISDLHSRLGARLFAGLMLVHLVLIAGLMLLINAAWHEATGLSIWHDLDALVVLGGAASIVVSYVLLRAGHYRPALILYIASTLAVPLTAPFVPDPNSEIGLVATAMIPVLLASIAFSSRIVFGVLLVAVLGPCMRLLFADMPFKEKGTGFALVVAVAVAGSLSLVFRRHLAALEQRRLAQFRASEERYRLLFETITDGIMVVGRDATVLEVNGATCRQLGYSRDELLGMQISAISGRSSIDVDAAHRAALERGHLTFATTHRRQDGSTMPVELVVTTIVFDGVPAIFALVRDLTERHRMEAEKRRLEEQLQQTVKMESVGQLAGGVAHDFNNLLTVILGNAEIGLEGLPADSLQAACLQQIMKAGGSAVGLTRQLLAFSRKQILSPRPVDLNQVVAQTERMLNRLIGEDVRLQTDREDGLWPVHVDPSLVEQALVNFAVNARDAMPDGGVLTIETANATVDATYHSRHPDVEPGEYATITVTDTGTGMPEEVRARLFEPFFTTKPKSRGTGLGLATTYGAVKQSGGFITVHSEVGWGSSFKVFLTRLWDASPVAGHPAAVVPVGGGRETILVVEDDADVRALAVRFLTGLGYTVLATANGEEALELARGRGEPIDAVVTDVVLPGLNGRQTAERLVQLHPECRALYTSGYPDDVIMHRGVLDDGIAFVAKPYTQQALGTKVRELLDRK
jgi:two-component system, cell cycle sensor histidine kinase and response regulator CckA